MKLWVGASLLLSLLLLLCMNPALCQESSSSVARPATVYNVSSFRELQAAAHEVKAQWGANPNATGTVLIRLLPGTFDMLATINFDTAPSGGALLLEGAGEDATILTCGGRASSALNFSSAMDITISGISFQSCSPALLIDFAPHGQSSDAGADWMTVVSVLVEGCSFRNNSGTRAGAAVFRHVPALHVDRCVFEDNSSPSTGAASFTDISQSLRISRSSFTWNTCFGQYPYPGNGVFLVEGTTNTVVIEHSSFVDNAAVGVYDMVGVGRLVEPVNVSIHDCVFANASASGAVGIGAIYIDTGLHINITGSSFINASAPDDYGTGGTRITYFTSLSITDTLVYKCSNNASNGWGGITTITFTPGSELVWDNVSFINNTDDGYAGIPAGMVAGVSRATLTRIRCINNSAMSDMARGAIVLYAAVSVYVNESTFLHNSGNCDANNIRKEHQGASVSNLPTVDYFRCGGGAVFVFQSPTVFVNSEFRGNWIRSLWSSGGAILAQSTQAVHIINCTFHENQAASGGAVAAIANSVIMVDLPLFQDLDRGQTGCQADPFATNLRTTWPQLWDVFDSSSIMSTSFTNNFAIAGGAISILDSALAISFMPQLKCTVPFAQKVFFGNNSALTGGAIASLRASGAFFIAHSTFDGNKALDHSQLPVELFPTVAIMDGGESVALSNGCGGGNGGAICFSTTSIYKGSNQAIASSSFTNNTAVYGGALYITADEHDCPKPDTCNVVFITGLQQCRADFVGLYTPGPGNYLVPGTHVSVTDNKAVAGAGGGMYLEHTSIVQLECGEDAKQESNGISSCIEGSPFNVSTPMCGASWAGNVALDGAYGDKIASSPINYTVAPVAPSQLARFSSGDSFPLQFIVFDMFNQEHTVSSVNQARAADVLFNVAALAVADGDTLAEYIFRSTLGRMDPELSTVTFEAKPGTVQLITTAVINKVRRTLPTVEMNVTVRNCRIGEFSAKNGYLCLSCDVGRYNLHPEGSTCEVCPGDATCMMDTSQDVNPIISPKSQIFQSNPFSAQMFQCPNSKICDFAGREDALLEYQYSLTLTDPWLPSSIAAFNQSYYYSLQCAEGYTGPVCALCDVGWGQSNPAECVRCTTNGVITSLLIFVMNCISVIPLLLSMQTAMVSAEKWGSLKNSKIFMSELKNRLATEAVCLKTIVSYLQVIGMFKWIQFTSTAMIKINVNINILSGTQAVSEKIVYATSSVVAIKCAGNFGLNPSSSAMIVSFAVPIAGFLLLCVIWGFMDVWQSLWLKAFPKKTKKHAKPIAAMEHTSSFSVMHHTEASFLQEQERKKADRSVFLNAGKRSVFNLFKESVHPAGRVGEGPTSSEPTVMVSRGPSDSHLDSGHIPSSRPLGRVRQAPFEEGAFEEAMEEQPIDFDALQFEGRSKRHGNVSVFDKGKAESRGTKLTSAAIVAFIVTTFYYYSSIVQQTILIFMCYTLDEQGGAEPLAVQYGLNFGSRWIMNYDAICFEGEHLFLVFFLGIPGILFSVGTPLLWAWCLTHNRWHLDEANFKARYSFMYEDYKPEFYAWGSVEMLRKLALMSVLVLLSDAKNPPGVQLISATSIAVAMLLLHTYLKPNVSALIHDLELMAELTICFTLQYCVYFTYDSIPAGYAAFTLILGFVNILVLAIMVLAWFRLKIDNMIMTAGLDSDAVHQLSSRTLVAAMWKDNEFNTLQHGAADYVVAKPIICCYIVGHWCKKQFDRVRTKVHLIIHGDL